MSNQDYFAYVLRLWRTGNDKPWHATLENAYVKERYSFGALSDLVAFLGEMTNETLEISGRQPADSATGGQPDEKQRKR
ncbi:MAG: hypothetical protein H6649_08540 [Caldilineae bacterium]|nr:hypothetical protein [Anaerolineae bacterium]MCB0198433.1 hypothetical protein [Anaerolineae bacterium]MCB0203652.1 hypothetical protein [Anaerolineae bacterium]MCB0256257.1 hypothetical protein [Anaerolineae bacterium]MCB9154087.1 hypothetical protein [Caldilineae bacterium]